jgi:hypothetical protein
LPDHGWLATIMPSVGYGRFGVIAAISGQFSRAVIFASM